MVLEYLAERGQVPAPDWMTEYATALAVPAGPAQRR